MDRKEKEFLEYLDEGIDLSLLEKDSAFLQKVNISKKRKGGWRKFTAKAAIFLVLLASVYLFESRKHFNSEKNISLNKEATKVVLTELEKVQQEVNADYQLIEVVAEIDSLEKLVVTN